MILIATLKVMWTFFSTQSIQNFNFQKIKTCNLEFLITLIKIICVVSETY